MPTMTEEELIDLINFAKRHYRSWMSFSTAARKRRNWPEFDLHLIELVAIEKIIDNLTDESFRDEHITRQ